MYDINIPKLPQEGLEGLLRKRLATLVIITEDLVEEEIELGKARQLVAIDDFSSLAGKDYFELTTEQRRLRRAWKKLEDSADLKKRENFDADLRKRAEQILLISLEMRRRRILVNLTIAGLHPRIQKAFTAEMEKLNMKKAMARPKLIRSPKPRLKAKRNRK